MEELAQFAYTFLSFFRLLNLVAEEMTIEDTYYYLMEALRKNVIELEVFLKVSILNPVIPSICHCDAVSNYNNHKYPGQTSTYARSYSPPLILPSPYLQKLEEMQSA